MTARELITLMRAVPFVPFEIRVSDNRSFVLEHPELMSLTADRRTILLSVDPDEDNNYQTVERIEHSARHERNGEFQAPPAKTQAGIIAV